MIHSTNITTYLEMIPDPRTFRLKHHLVDIIAITLLSKICGAEGWEDIHEFGLARNEWLSTFLELPAGIPSPDTFRRVLSNIDPTAFLDAFLEWSKAVQEIAPEFVNIDGKTLRSTLKRCDNPLHIVSAWCENNHMMLGQLRSECKSNEIKAIPELLKQLTLPEGCIITIDAAGTQKNIASQIRDLKADYVLALKGNQQKLHDEVENYFNQAIDVGGDYVSLLKDEEESRGHGRVVLRKIYVTDDIDWLPQKNEWRDIKSIVRQENIRISEGKEQTEIRYFISSLPPEPKQFARVIRGHWAVENNCHWILDVVFREDDSLITEGYAPENLRTINLLAAKMLKKEKSCKKGLRAKQFKAALDKGYLYRVLSSAFF